MESDFLPDVPLALGASARNTIQNHLRKTSLTRRHIKLIFAGTEWVNGKNAAYIFTAGGMPLLTQQKREPFDQYDKKTGITRRENLVDHDNLLLFLDVAGLGRISYTICKDFLDMEEVSIRADLLCTSLLIASCYTGELGPFFNVANGLAKLYGTVSLVANSCAAIRQKESLEGHPAVGLLAVPTCSEKKQLGCFSVPYTTCDELCTLDNCSLCSCMELYTLHYPQQLSKSFNISHEKL